MDKIMSLLKEFDIASMLPEIGSFMGQLKGWLIFALLVGPVLMAAMGAVHFFFPPKEANHHLGYRSYWSMGSVQVWQYAQRLSGMIFMIGGGGFAVVMLIICLFFGLMQPSTMVITSLVCVIIEALAAIAAVVVIEVMLRKYYDIHGNKK
jgi:uncharacterized membrane protein